VAASRPAERAPAPGSQAPGAGLDAWSAPRRPALDHIRVLLIAAVIVVHAVMGYAAFFDGWPYHAVQEVALPDAAVIVVFALFAPVGIFLMSLLFLLAGLLTPSSVDRKGPARFARDRLLRLGIPFAAYALVVWPALNYALDRSFGVTSLGYGRWLTRELPSNGPLWFVGVLLLFSLGYAAWRALWPAPAAPTTTVPVLLLVAVLVAGASFAVRLVLPYASPTPLDLNEWQWPECLALFVVGLAGGRQGWVDGVPERVARAAGRATAAAGVGVAGFLLVALGVGVPQEEFLGGPHWPALVVACLEGFLTVFGSLWLLALAQRRWNAWSRRSRPLARSAYAAFVLQGPVLIGLALLLRPLPIGAEIKAPLVALGGLALSFGVGWLLVTRVRLIGRVL
jgi:hypothetical protein